MTSVTENGVERTVQKPQRQGASPTCVSLNLRPRSVLFDYEHEHEDEGRGRYQDAFTLIELLVVIAVAGILAALAVPAIKEFGRSNQQVAATRQMLDGVGRARQLAIANRTTVYMVFLPNGFLTQPAYSSLPPADQDQALRLAPNQGRSFALISLRTIGDQPGRSWPQYLTEWTPLTRGWIIAPSKFDSRVLPPVDYTVGSDVFSVTGFERTTDDPDNLIALPLPSEQSPIPPVGSEWVLPYIAFDYQGRVVSGVDEFIPLARGFVEPAVDANGDFSPVAATITESPETNSLDVPNLIHIDWLTGRAKLEQREIE